MVFGDGARAALFAGGETDPELFGGGGEEPDIVGFPEAAMAPGVSVVGGAGSPLGGAEGTAFRFDSPESA